MKASKPSPPCRCRSAGRPTLGRDISTARRRRNMTIATLAERAFIGRNTITRVERGEPGVALGVYATVLFVLGLADRLASLADPATDQVGLTLAEEQLPKRVRAKAEAQ